MNRWSHISQIPEPIRQTMTITFVVWERQDLGIEALVDGICRDQDVTERVRTALQSSANRVRIPELCRILKEEYPDQSLRDTFKAVALFTGIHEKNVQKLFYGTYGRVKCSKSA